MNKKLIIILGIIITLVVLPLLKPGYMFSVDHFFNPNGWLPKLGGHVYWIALISKVFSFVGIPIWFLEKLVIIFAFVIPSIGGYLLFKNSKNFFAILFGVLILFFNPFFFDRFFDGQSNIYLSLSIYPLFFYFIKRFFSKLEIKHGIYLGLISLLLCLTSIHNTVFIFVVFFVFFLTYFFKHKNIKYIKSTLKTGIIIILFNLTWFLPIIILENKYSQKLIDESKSFNKEIILEFQKIPEEKSIYTETLKLKGYWAEYKGRFKELKTEYDKFSDKFIYIIWILVIIGIYSRLRKGPKSFDVGLIALGIVSYMLAIGVTKGNIFEAINMFLYNNIDIYKGLREPQKWVMFLVIVYAYFGAFGVKKIYNILDNKLKKKYYYTIIFIIAIIPILYTPKILLGFGGNITIKDYPREWMEIKSYLENENINENCKQKNIEKVRKCYNIVIFPWHEYTRISWLDRNTNHSRIFSYFDRNILIGDNVELGKVYSTSKRYESKEIEKYIGKNGIIWKDKNNKNQIKFINAIKSLGPKYILLSKDLDYKRYERIFKSIEKSGIIKKIKENQLLILYEI